MPAIFGEAFVDPTSKKFYYQIRTEQGETLLQSEPEFSSKIDAEGEMVTIIRGFDERVKRESKLESKPE